MWSGDAADVVALATYSASGNAIVLPVCADLRAASRISVTVTFVFSAETLSLLFC